MKIVRLFQSASIVGEAQGTESSDKQLTKRALLVYAGKFDSMDGEVEVTPEHIERLASNHNLSHAKLSAGQIGMKDCPPVQVDHSTSGWDTVGRLVGPVEAGDFEGKPGLYGNLLFLGSDAVERVKDGRWTHLSLGADLEAGKINEMTVTPFPAAAKASLLSKKFGKGEPMHPDQEKMRKHLMESDKMSEKDADDKLSKMTDDEKKELSAKLANGNDVPEKPKDDKQEKPADSKPASLTAEQKKSFSRLSANFKLASAGAAASVKKVQLSGRIAKLRSDAKITPAEEKGIDLDKLAKLPQESLETMFEVFEKRQPVVLVGQYGRVQAEDIATLAKDVQEKKMVGEMAESMHFSKGMVKRLAGMPTSMDEKQQMSAPGEAAGSGISLPTSMDTHEQLGAHLKHLSECMANGKMDEANNHLKSMLSMHAKMGEAGSNPSYAGMPETQPSHLSALAESVEKLQNQFEELVNLASPVFGTTEEEE